MLKVIFALACVSANSLIVSQLTRWIYLGSLLGDRQIQCLPKHSKRLLKDICHEMDLLVGSNDDQLIGNLSTGLRDKYGNHTFQGSVILTGHEAQNKRGDTL